MEISDKITTEIQIFKAQCKQKNVIILIIDSSTLD